MGQLRGGWVAVAAIQHLTRTDWTFEQQPIDHAQMKMETGVESSWMHGSTPTPKTCIIRRQAHRRVRTHWGSGQGKRAREHQRATNTAAYMHAHMRLPH